MLQITDYCPQGVTAVHDEFWGMGRGTVHGFMEEGTVVVDAGEVKGKGFYYMGL